MRTLLALLALLAGFGWPAAETLAQDYPNKPIELMVPFGAGGGSDILARNIAKVIQDEKLLPQPLVVVNKPGGGGAVGYSEVAGKKGNPYTIATVSSSFWTTPLLGRSPVTYDQFTPVAGLAYDTYLLVVHQQSPFKTVQDVVAAAKKGAKAVSVAGTGATSDDAVVTYIFQRATGTELNLIPFRSGGEVMTALLGQQVQLAWANPGEAISQLEGKTARALAVAAEKRLKGLPDVPTFKELGIDLVFRQLRGVVMPAGAPREAVQRLEQALLAMTKTSAWQDGYVDRNMIISAPMPAGEFARAVESTNEMYRQAFTDLGVLKK